jgi:hypothetical protein
MIIKKHLTKVHFYISCMKFVKIFKNKKSTIKNKKIKTHQFTISQIDFFCSIPFRKTSWICNSILAGNVTQKSRIIMLMGC